MSVPTVASLCAALGHHLTPVAGFTAPEAEVTAVHVSELDDPTAYLSGGELLLTTGLVLPHSLLGCRRYVGRLVEARVSALGYGLGPVTQAVPEQLVAACRDAGLPLLAVPAPTPFTMISRAYWSALSRATEQELADAVAAHRALVEAAASADPVPAVLRRLAGVLGGWAALLDATGELVDAHPIASAVHADVLRLEVTRLEAAGARSSATFTVADEVLAVFPLAVGGRTVGYLAAGSPRRFGPEQRRVVVTAAALLSLDTVRGQRDRSVVEATRRCVALLLDAGMGEAARLLAARTGSPVPQHDACVLAFEGSDLDALIEVVSAWAPDALLVRTGPGTAWAVLAAHHPDAAELAERLRGQDRTVRGVLSEPVPLERLGAVRSRLARAASTLSAGVVEIPRRISSSQIAEAVDRLTAGGSPDVVEGLVAYLRHRGQWEQAARALQLHRNTLRYRVGRARDLLEVDLDDADVAAELWLALRRRGLA